MRFEKSSVLPVFFFKEKDKNWKVIHNGIRLQEDGSSR